jgi:hypothetical protein
MTTVCRRALVSLAATMTITLALGCVRQPSRTMPDGPSRMSARPFAVRFENEGRQYVHVYLVGERREWLLGRVEPGAIRTLQIPDEALGGSAFVRLAVLAGDRAKFQAARQSGAALTIAQPASVILSQRWRFSQGALTSLGR